MFRFARGRARPYSRGVARKEDPNDRTQIQAHDPLVGQTFDRRFHIDYRIAVGGFGAIYHATHRSSGHQFALKILHPRLATDLGVIARFRREGETLTRLRCEHTIIAYETGATDDGTMFIVLELLQGESLFDRFRDRGPFPWRDLARIARDVCSSLEEAHGLGIIHRDLKPTNINLERKDGRDDFVKVLDFGIAKILRDSDLDSADLTNAGQMIGTLDYMSPEQMVGGACTGQTDIYTLGIVMYEMLSGRRPFAEAASPAAVLAAMLRTAPPPVGKLVPGIPDGMSYIVMRCLERDVNARWPDVILLGAALDTVLRGEDPRLQIAATTSRGEATETVPFALGDDATAFEPPTSRTAGGAVSEAKARAALGEAQTMPAPHVPSPHVTSRGSQPRIPAAGAATPTPITNKKAPTAPPPVAAPAVPPILFGPSAPTVVAGTTTTKSGAMRPSVLTPSSPTPIPSTPIPVAAPFRSSSAQSASGSMATPLPGTDLALFPPAEGPPGPRKPPTGPPPMAVLAPPGPHVPLPHAPERPVMNPAAFMPGAPVQPMSNPGSAPLPMAGAPMPGSGPTAYPQSGPQFDMAQLAARDAAMRRIVWIVVLVLGGVIGIALAVRL